MSVKPFTLTTLVMQTFTVICLIILNPSLVSSKNVSSEFYSIGDNNKLGEYAFGEFYHLHISNQPLFLPNVTTRNGVVRGIIVKTKPGREVYAFLGIPYARPPLGELRFKRPIPTGNWPGPYLDAVQLPNTCSQAPTESFPGFRGESMWNPNTPLSEDCLYLNIWVPTKIFNQTKQRGNETEEKATVMFWIYGGGFYSGSSTLEVYDGSKLADENDIIVVSAQYRVGPLGFLYFGNEYAPGNVALLDQNMALRWVYDNIHVFGGNPELITLFGESAGSVSVTYHLLSYLSQPYFKRAILMSGVAIAPWAFQTAASAMKNSYDLAKKAGCGVGAEGIKTQLDTIYCLYKVSPERLVEIQQEQQAAKFWRYPFVPTVDGYFLRDIPRKLLQKTLKRTDIMIGNTKDEGSQFAQYDFVLNSSSTPTFTSKQFMTNMDRVFETSTPCHKNAVFNFYTNWVYPEDGDANRKHLTDAIGDNLIICPNKAFADSWAGHGSNVFYYLFSHRTSSNPWAEWMGIIHGDEVEYIFGLPIRNVKHTSEEKALSVHMMKLFTDFAKTGSPSPNWKSYSQRTPVYLDLNATKISDKSPMNVYGPRPEACSFWNYQL